VTFRAIAGNNRVIALLARSVVRERLPQSLIFGGPQGVGKARTALALAQTVNCQSQVRDGELAIDACGRCASCQRIARGIHPDVVTLAPGESGSIKIEAVRDAIDTLAYRPFEGRRRLVIIDDADALGASAQNALLKTLEEPGPSSLFVLVTSRPDALLPTVRSRCARLRFSRLTPGEVADVLVRDHGYTGEDAHAVAAVADGSIARALEARAADFTSARRAAEHVLSAAARSADARGRLDLAKDLLPRKPTATVSEREYLSVHLRAMSSLLRDVGLVSTGSDPGALANTDLRDDLEKLSTRFPYDRSVRAFNAVDQALEAIERNVSPKNVADWLVLQL
jgi:DNA polymerase III subunit delta'